MGTVTVLPVRSSVMVMVSGTVASSGLERCGWHGPEGRSVRTLQDTRGRHECSNPSTIGVVRFVRVSHTVGHVARRCRPCKSSAPVRTDARWLRNDPSSSIARSHRCRPAAGRRLFLLGRVRHGAPGCRSDGHTGHHGSVPGCRTGGAGDRSSGHRHRGDTPAADRRYGAGPTGSSHRRSCLGPRHPDCGDHRRVRRHRLRWGLAGSRDLGRQRVATGGLRRRRNRTDCAGVGLRRRSRSPASGSMRRSRGCPMACRTSCVSTTAWGRPSTSRSLSERSPPVADTPPWGWRRTGTSSRGRCSRSVSTSLSIR